MWFVSTCIIVQEMGGGPQFCKISFVIPMMAGRGSDMSVLQCKKYITNLIAS